MYYGVTSGEISTGIILKGNDLMDISSGGTANNTTINSRGDMYIYSGGTANSTTINSGYMYIYSGGTATEIIENGGYVYVADGAFATFASNTIEGFVLSYDDMMTVHKNTIANSTTINANGYMYISSGGMANSTTINDHGYMDISSGGVANSTTINAYGCRMFIYSGGTANSTTINGGCMYIDSGGVANNTTVNSGGSMRIDSGGTANSTTINSGYMNIYSGGTATEIVENGGEVGVQNGAYVTFASNTIEGFVLSQDKMTVHKNTIANSTTVNSYGYMYIYSGGIANNTTINSSGSMFISSGGMANSTTINSGGDMWIHSGGTANSTIINDWGYMDIWSGGTATDIIENGGYVYVADGAFATFASNTIDGVVLSNTGMTVHKNTIANSTTINDWGYMSISSGGVANNTTINSGGSMRISSGGVANSTTINSRGRMWIYSGGVANNTTISGGVICNYGDITIGDSAIIGSLENYGNMDFNISVRSEEDGVLLNDWTKVINNGTLSITVNAEQAAGEYLLIGNVETFNHTITVGDGSVTYGTLSFSEAKPPNSHARITVDPDQLNGYTFTYNGKTYTLKLENKLLSIIIDGAGKVVIYKGSEKTFEGPESNDAVLRRNDDNKMHIYEGGVANRTAVRDGGEVIIFQGGVANNVGVSANGNMVVKEHGIAHIVTVRSGGEVKVEKEGTIYSASVIGGVVDNLGDVNNTFVSGGGVLKIHGTGQAVNTEIKTSGTVSVFKTDEGKGARQTQVTADGVLQVSDGGKVLETTAVTGGKILISKTGVAEKSYISSGGIMNVSQGGIANLTSVYSSGLLTVSKEGIANDTVLYSKGMLNVSAGGVANRTVVSSGGSAYIYTQGIANNLSVEVGSVCVSGGVVKELTVNDRGQVFIYTQGTVTGGEVNVSGKVHVSSGGKATQLVINSGGYVYVSSGGTAASTKINGFGSMFISYSGKINAARIESAGYLALNGTAAATVVNDAGRMHIYLGGVANTTSLNNGTLWVHSGGTAKGTQVNQGGNLQVSACGLASNTTVNALGEMYVCSDSLASNTTVKELGNVYVVSGGTHKGTLQIESNSKVTAEAGSVIDFTVADRTSTDDYLINDLSRIYGTPTYTITVSEDQEAGMYKLAQGASAFNKTISICTTDTCFGELTINSDTLTFDGVTYDLNNVDGNLTLTITKPETEYVIGNFNGMFEFTPDGSGTIYTPAGKQEIAGTLDPAKWEVVGAGDFNKSGTDGLLWIEKNTGYVYIQNDLTNFDEVNNMSNCLGILGDGYEILSTGDFTGTGIDGVIMQGPAFGDASVSLNYGLPIWGREADGTTFAGWLGALVNTWQPDDALKGDTSDLADINAKNYMYEVVSVGDYNGDGVDDVMLQNIMPKTVDGVTITGSGDVFTFLTGSMEAVKAGAAPTVAYAGCATDGWEVMGSGDFDGDGIDDVLLSDGTGVAGWQMMNGQRTENFWFGNLGANEEIAGIADLNNDGTDDILVLNTATDDYHGWLVKNGAITGSLAIA